MTSGNRSLVPYDTSPHPTSSVQALSFCTLHSFAWFTFCIVLLVLSEQFLFIFEQTHHLRREWGFHTRPILVSNFHPSDFHQLWARSHTRHWSISSRPKIVAVIFHVHFVEFWHESKVIICSASGFRTFWMFWKIIYCVLCIACASSYIGYLASWVHRMLNIGPPFRFVVTFSAWSLKTRFFMTPAKRNMSCWPWLYGVVLSLSLLI